MNEASLQALAAGRARRWPSFIRRFVASVETGGPCWVWKAGRTKGYGYIEIKGVKVMAHRAAFAAVKGEIPQNVQVDHICRNRACVRPSHLRLATNKQNSEHRPSVSTNTSGYRGVTRHRDGTRWVAQVKHNQQNHYLGIYETAELAAEAAREKRVQLFTHNDDDRRSSFPEVPSE